MTICTETRNRIRVAVAAWAYEVRNDPIMSDAEFDALARSIDLGRSTQNQDMDQWFQENFNPNTGLWVYLHPDKGGLERIYRMFVGSKRSAFLIWLVAP